MIHKKKRDGQSNESMIRDFTRAFRSSGIGDDTKEHQTHKPKANKNQQRKSAQRKREAREEREFLIKTGKLVERPTFRRR